jgi:hypothetical protein
MSDLIPNDYKDLLAKIKQRIRSAQYEALLMKRIKNSNHWLKKSVGLSTLSSCAAVVL